MTCSMRSGSHWPTSVARRFERHLAIRARELLAEATDDLVHDLGEIALLALEPQRPGRDARHVEQVVDECGRGAGPGARSAASRRRSRSVEIVSSGSFDRSDSSRCSTIWSGVSGVRSSCEAIERNSSRALTASRASRYSRALSTARLTRCARSSAMARSAGPYRRPGRHAERDRSQDLVARDHWHDQHGGRLGQLVAHELVVRRPCLRVARAGARAARRAGDRRAAAAARCDSPSAHCSSTPVWCLRRARSRWARPVRRRARGRPCTSRRRSERRVAPRARASVGSSNDDRSVSLASVRNWRRFAISRRSVMSSTIDTKCRGRPASSLRSETVSQTQIVRPSRWRYRRSSWSVSISPDSSRRRSPTMCSTSSGCARSWIRSCTSSAREYPTMSASFWFARSQCPSVAMCAMPTAALSNVAS